MYLTPQKYKYKATKRILSIKTFFKRMIKTVSKSNL